MKVLSPPRLPADPLNAQVERLAQTMRQVQSQHHADAPVPVSRLREAARSFEALFYSLLIKQMRQSTQELGEGFFAADQADIFGGLFDYYLGQFLAQRQHLGIGRLIEEQYGRPYSAAQNPGTTQQTDSRQGTAEPHLPSLTP